MKTGIPSPQIIFGFLLPCACITRPTTTSFVHAGLKEALPLEAQLSEDLLWIRDEFIASDHDFGKRVVFGHTPFNNPLVKPNKIGVDTGAVYGNRLTCVKLPEMVFFHA